MAQGFRTATVGMSADWPPKIIVPMLVRPHTRAAHPVCFRMMCYLHDRQDRLRSHCNRRLRNGGSDTVSLRELVRAGALSEIGQ